MPYHPSTPVHILTSTSAWFVVPVPKDAVLAAARQKFPLANLRLLDIVSTPDFFPNGFPEGMHPILTNIAVNGDTRMSVLQIDGILKNAAIMAPYVAKSDSDAPITATLNTYIAGPNGPLPQGLVPAVASSLLFGGTPIRLGQFSPTAEAYMVDGSGTNSARAAWALVPNTLSGPGVYPEAVDFSFTTARRSRYGARTIKTLINTPLLLPSGLCQRNTYYFTNATALPVLRTGAVTFGPGADGVGLTSGGLMQAGGDGRGIYGDVDGFSACAQTVGNNIEECEVAAGNVDPVSLL